MSKYFLVIFTCVLASCTEPTRKGADTIKMGKQTWMRQNLSVVTFRNGDSIPEMRTDEEWEQARFEQKPAWCYVKNNPDSDSLLGKLYNWYAVSDPRGLAPVGWHIPSDDEWTELTASNKSMMFTVQRAGTRTFIGEFENEGWGFWWSATGNESHDHQYAWYRVLGSKDDSLHRDTYVKGSGYSVRCIKDAGL